MTAIRNRIATCAVLLMCGCASAADPRSDQLLGAVRHELSATLCEGAQPQIREMWSEKYVSYYAPVVIACDGMPHEEYELRGFVFDRASMSRVNDDDVVNRAAMQQAIEELAKQQRTKAEALGFMCELETSTHRELYVNEKGDPVLLINYPYPNQACSVAYNLTTQSTDYPFD